MNGNASLLYGIYRRATRCGGYESESCSYRNYWMDDEPPEEGEKDEEGEDE